MNFDLDNTLSLIAASGTAGLCFAAGLRFFQWLLTFIAGRSDARTAHLDAVTKALIDELRKELERLKARCEESEERMRECERKHAETEAELLGVKRLLQAQGDIRNRIQAGVAAERRGDEG